MTHQFKRFFQCVVALAVAACSIDNSLLPSELQQHLSAHGIVINIIASGAPLPSRVGYVEIKDEAGVLEKLVQTFALARQGGNLSRSECARHFPFASTEVTEVWWIGGRPATLELKSGVQFEFLCFVRSADSRTFLVAAYAYG